MKVKKGEFVKIKRPTSIKIDVSCNKDGSVGFVEEINGKDSTARVKTVGILPNGLNSWESMLWLKV